MSVPRHAIRWPQFDEEISVEGLVCGTPAV
jgi:hypothetical protein